MAKTILGKIGLIPKGEYNGEVSYKRLDFVKYNGSSFVALKDNQGIAPGTDDSAWQLLAIKGEKGDKPINGIDYNTEQQKEDLKNEVVTGATSVLENYMADKKTELDTYKNSKEQELNDFTSTQKTELNSYSEGLINSFNMDATNKITEFNTNSSSKITEFNQNATEQTDAFNGVVSDTLNAFNSETSQYVKKTDRPTKDIAGAIKSGYCFVVDNNGSAKCTSVSYENYLSAGDGNFVSIGTLKNVILGKELVSNTDFPTSDKGGVVKQGASFKIAPNGVPYSYTFEYPSYVANGDGIFISKGTLENVIKGKELVSGTDNASKEKAGVVKVDADSYGINISNSGHLYATNTDKYSVYEKKGNNYAISKGTLEMLFNRKIGSVDTILDTINGEVV